MDISTINKRFEKVEIIESKEQLREQLSQDVQAFMDKGGKITMLPSEFAEQPVKPKVDFNDLMGWS